MTRSSLAPVLLGMVLTAQSALAQASHTLASQTPSSATLAATPPAAVSDAPGAITNTSMGSVTTNCVAAADAPKPKHRGFGGFVKRMVKEHGVQALEIATGVGAMSMMSKSMTSMAATNGMQMAAQNQAAAAVARQSAMSGAANAQAAMLAGSMMPGVGRGGPAAAATQAAQAAQMAQLAAMQQSAGAPVAQSQTIATQVAPATGAPANCTPAANVNNQKAGTQ